MSWNNKEEVEGTCLGFYKVVYYPAFYWANTENVTRRHASVI
jgi:hypothetical protein